MLVKQHCLRELRQSDMADPRHQSVFIHASSLYVSVLHQDFADIVSQPSLEGPADSGLQEEEEENVQEESSESSFLSPAAMNLVVQVHQRLCLGYAQSLWYQSTAPANHSKDHINALVSSYQIASPMMSRFYHLIGQCLLSLIGTHNIIAFRWIVTSVLPPQILNWTSS